MASSGLVRLRGWFAGGTILALISAGIVAAAADEQAAPPPRPVRSNECTASSGRQPLSTRIAMSIVVPTQRKPVQENPDPLVPVEGPPQEEPPQGVEPPAAPEEKAAAAESVTLEEPVAPEPDPIEPRRRRSKAAAKPPATAADQPAGDHKTLLSKVKARLATIVEPAPPVDPKTGRPVPPRLALEVIESQVEVFTGDSSTWQIRLRNDGGIAHDVSAVLFFAEGLEPTGSSGGRASLSDGEVRFASIERLDPGKTLELSVTAKAMAPGPVTFRVEVGCREIPGNSASEGVVVILPR